MPRAPQNKKPTLEDLARDARARAQGFEHQGAVLIGTVTGVPEGFEARWFVPHELKKGRADKFRAMMTNRGAFLAPDGLDIVVSGVTGAEVWLVPSDVAEAWRRLRKERDDKEKRRLGVRV